MFEYRQIIRTAGLTALAYGALAVLAIELTRRSGGVALVWPAAGMLVAVLATLRLPRWGVVLAACSVVSFVITLALRGSVIAATGFAITNLVEVLATALLLRRLNAHRRMLHDANSVLTFALIGGVAGPALSAPFAAATTWLAFGATPLATMSDWCLGHGLGMLIAAPLALIAVAPELTAGRRRPAPRELARFVVLIASVAGTAVLVFAQETLPLLFLPALPIMVATVRLGRLGSVAALLALAIPGAALTMAGHGPIHLVSVTAPFRLQFFQLYLATMFLIALPTAAMLTRQRTLTAQLREREAALRLLADHSSDVLLSLDIDGGIRFASPSVRALGGYDPDALVGRNALELIELEHRGLVQRAHLDALAAPETTVTVEYQGCRNDGSTAWFETNTRAVRDDDGGIVGVVSAIRDVSHRKSVERQLRQEADTDALTGLANRRPFLAALDAAIAGAGERPAAVAMLDLDHFKQVNDRYGHAAGDAALVTLAEVFLREVRADDLVARLGGEEFAVLLSDVEPQEAAATCERLRLAIAAQPILAPGAPLFRVTASFGLAAVTAGMNGEALLAAADGALYAAKDAGRNRLAVAA